MKQSTQSSGATRWVRTGAGPALPVVLLAALALAAREDGSAEAAT